jgi:hypothetical protein
MGYLTHNYPWFNQNYKWLLSNPLNIHVMTMDYLNQNYYGLLAMVASLGLMDELLNHGLLNPFSFMVVILCYINPY